MTRDVPLFDFTPRGWVNYTGDHPLVWGVGASWMDAEFQARARRDGRQLQATMARLTRRQLLRFVASAGFPNLEMIRRDNKRELVELACRLQTEAWYPYVEVVR